MAAPPLADARVVAEPWVVWYIFRNASREPAKCMALCKACVEEMSALWADAAGIFLLKDPPLEAAPKDARVRRALQSEATQSFAHRLLLARNTGFARNQLATLADVAFSERFSMFKDSQMGSLLAAYFVAVAETFTELVREQRPPQRRRRAPPLLTPPTPTTTANPSIVVLPLSHTHTHSIHLR